MSSRRAIRDNFPNWDCGYSSTVLMPDRRVFTVYYLNIVERLCAGGNFFERN
jgi:hypothetical protein